MTGNIRFCVLSCRSACAYLSRYSKSSLFVEDIIFYTSTQKMAHVLYDATYKKNHTLCQFFCVVKNKRNKTWADVASRETEPTMGSEPVVSRADKPMDKCNADDDIVVYDETHLKVCIGLCIVFIVFVVFILNRQSVRSSKRIVTRLHITTIWTIALILWPILWVWVVQRLPARNVALVMMGFILPLFTIGNDIASLRCEQYEENIRSKRQYLSMDANAICSMIFALSAYMGTQKNVCCNRIFLVAIVACACFVAPSPFSNSGQVLIEATQKAILSYATGLLLTGVLLHRMTSNAQE